MNNRSRTRILACTLPLLLAFSGAAFAQEDPDPEQPPVLGKDRAIEAILESLARMEVHFAELLEKVPEQARPGIERALQANREGRMKALEALGYAPPEPEGAAVAEAMARPDVGEVLPEIRTPEEAQAAIADGRRTTELALAGVRDRVPEPARPEIDRAIAEVRRGTEDALAALRARPDRPERPDTPLAERPQALPRPERPDRPGR